MKTIVRTLIASLGVAALAGASARPAFADATKPAGNVIVARPGGSALLIWDASADVTAIVANKVSDADAKTSLERDAARVLADSLAKIDKDATSVAVRVIYDKTGAVSPIYGSATFAGVERYAILHMSGADARGDRDHWRELSSSSTPPAWFAFDVSGELPAR